MNQLPHDRSQHRILQAMMPRLTRIAQRRNAMLLVAAVAVVQVCTGFTGVVAYAASMPAATAAGGCCNEGSEPACGSAQETAGAFNNCAPYCIVRQDAAKSDSVLPASESFKHAGLSTVGRVAFPPHSTRLSAAPRAANTTLLIYQFQRLLN